MADYVLSAKGTYDGSAFERGLKGSNEALEGFRSKATNVASKVAGALAAIGAATAVVNFGKAAIDGFAQYEQLWGGVQTLFKDSAGQLQQAANEAFRTAGMSANQYMETATSFSASLIQSLGGDTAKAAEYADDAIVAMSDNANKMGTSMDMIQNAYQGFAKGNYTMLDNLKLGYGGTQEEMQRLLDDAEKLSGVEYDISSFADVTKAIQVVQEEMGIAGATADEAAETIEGSVNAMKGAWSNWVAGLANENADLGKLTGDLVEAVGTAAENIVPRIGQIVASLVTVLVQEMPGALRELGTKLVNSLGAAADRMSEAGPMFLGAAAGLFEGILTAATDVLSMLPQKLSEMVSKAEAGLPAMASSMGASAGGMFAGIVNAVPPLLSALGAALTALVTSAMQLLPTLAPLVIQAASGLFQTIWQAVPTVVEGLLSAVGDMLESLAEFLEGFSLAEAAVGLFSSLADSMDDAGDSVIESLSAVLDLVVANIPTYVPALLSAAVSLFTAIVTAVPQILGILLSAVGSLIGKAVSNVPTFAGKLLNAGLTLFRSLATAATQAGPKVLTALGNALAKLPGKAREFVGRLTSAGADLVAGLAQGIVNNAGSVLNAIAQACGGVVDFAKSILGIHSPSTVFAAIGRFLMEGFSRGIDRAGGMVMSSMDGVVSKAMEIARGLSPEVSFSAADAAQVGRGYAGAVTCRTNRAAQDGGASGGNSYAFGDIYMQAEDLEGVNTLEQLLDMIEQAANINPSRKRRWA